MTKVKTSSPSLISLDLLLHVPCTTAFTPHSVPCRGLAFLPLTGWVGSQNVWFGGTEYHVLVPCWPGQAARAGVLQGPFFSVLGQAGWGPPKAQMSSPAHPLFCISWETWLSGSLSTREAVRPGASPWSFLGLWVTSLDPDFLA